MMRWLVAVLAGMMSLAFGATAYGSFWSTRIGATGSEQINAMDLTTDGGSIVAGLTTPSGPSVNDALVIKLNADGSVAWKNTYGSSGRDEANAVQQTADGGYIVAGYTDSFGATNGDAWVMKLNSSGGVVWYKTYGGTGTDFANSVRQTSDGGYIVAGGSDLNSAGSWDVWVFKLTAAVPWSGRKPTAAAALTLPPLSSRRRTAAT